MEVSLELLRPIRETILHTNITQIVQRKVERGYEFDASSRMPFFDTAILTFRVVCQCVFHQQENQFRENLPEHVLGKLQALEYQVYRGPNRIPRPNCVNPLFSALGIGRADEMSQTVWQEWSNLGTMSMKSAAAKFLLEFTKYDPGILDNSIESDGKRLSVKTAVRILAAYVVQRKFRHRRAYKPIRIIGRKILAFEKIQRFLIYLIRRKRLLEIRLFAQEKNYKKLIDMLLKGIPINNLVDGKMVPEYLSILKVGEANIPSRRTGKYLLYTSAKEKVKAALDLENGILLSDVAEIRAGCANFPQSKTADKYPNADLCISIISSRKTLYIQLVQDLEVQSKPAPSTAAKPIPGAKKISKPTAWDGLVPFGGKSMGWIMRVFPAMIESTLSQEETSSRGRFKGYTPAMREQNKGLERPALRADAELFSSLLVKGLKVDVWKVQKPSLTGNVKTTKEAEWESKVMYINWSKRRINVGYMPAIGLLGDPISNKGFVIEDMAEIRRGRVLPDWDERFHFELPNQSDVNKSKIMTIIAGEVAVTIKLKSYKIRNKLVNMFRVFMDHFKCNFTPLSDRAFNVQSAKKSVPNLPISVASMSIAPTASVQFDEANIVPSDDGSNKSGKSNGSIVKSIKSVAASFGMRRSSKSSEEERRNNYIQNAIDEGGSVQSKPTKSSDQNTVKSQSTYKSLKKMARNMILGPKDSKSQRSDRSEVLSSDDIDGAVLSISDQAIAASDRSESSSICSNSKKK